MIRRERRLASDWWFVVFVDLHSLKNEIDKRVVFLRSHDREREPAENAAHHCLWPRHLLGPIPRLLAHPNHDRGDCERNEIVRFVKDSADQIGTGLCVPQTEHAAEIQHCIFEIGRAKENPGYYHDQERKGDTQRSRKVVIETLSALATLECQHAAV